RWRARRREPRVAHVRRRARARRRALGAGPRGVEARAGRCPGAPHPDGAPPDRRRGRHVATPGDARLGPGARGLPGPRRAQEQRRGDRATAAVGPPPGGGARRVLAAAPVDGRGGGRVADGMDEGRVSETSGAESNIVAAEALLDVALDVARALEDPFARPPVDLPEPG